MSRQIMIPLAVTVLLSAAFIRVTPRREYTEAPASAWG